MYAGTQISHHPCIYWECYGPARARGRGSTYGWLIKTCRNHPPISHTQASLTIHVKYLSTFVSRVAEQGKNLQCLSNQHLWSWRMKPNMDKEEGAGGALSFISSDKSEGTGALWGRKCMKAVFFPHQGGSVVLSGQWTEPKSHFHNSRLTKIISSWEAKNPFPS